MEIKIECPCGTRFKFDAEPVNGRMPVGIGCPNCRLDATGAANAIIAQHLSQTALPPAPAPASAPAPVRVRLATAPAQSAPPPALSVSDPAAPQGVSMSNGLRISIVP